MFVGQLPARGRLLRRIDWPAIRQQARAALEALGLDIDVDQQALHLSIAQQQQVECAKALLRGCRIILFDEPTSPLTTHEVERLFAIMRRLRGDGCTLGFISHRMDEVLEISDDISVLRDGALVDTVARAGFDRVRLMSQMVGREMKVIPRRQWSAKSSAWRGWSAPGAPRSPRPSSACARAMPAGCGSMARTSRGCPPTR